MVRIFKTIEGAIHEIQEPQEDCWIAMTNPTATEIFEMSERFGIEVDDLRDAQTSGYPERPQSDIGRTIDNIEREAFARATASTPIQKPIVEPAPEPVQDPEIPFDPKPSQTIRITGSPEDYQKVIEYIKAMGIDYEEV